jgi:branched-chain amino acid aminotransferase
MAIQKTDKIWHNGKFIAWDDATLHVMSHVVHYGSSLLKAFAATRCRAVRRFSAPPNTCSASSTPPAFTALNVPFTRDEIMRAMIELVKQNGVWPCYIRPIVLRGYGEAGVNPFNSPTEIYIAIIPGENIWATTAS